MLEAVIVDPPNMKEAVIQVSEELEKMPVAKTPQLEHTVSWMKNQVGARRRKHTRKAKKGGKKHKKTRKH
jgi:hypothetical protein